jgi:hypothetical protein
MPCPSRRPERAGTRLLAAKRESALDRQRGSSRIAHEHATTYRDVAPASAGGLRRRFLLPCLSRAEGSRRRVSWGVSHEAGGPDGD